MKIQKDIRPLLEEKNKFFARKIKNNSLVFGSKNNVEMHIIPHENGLILHTFKYDSESKKVQDKKITLPGEVEFNKLTAYITQIIGIPEQIQKPSKEKLFKNINDYIEHAWREQKLKVSQALLQFGIWKRRGLSDKEKEAPKEFWKKLTIEELITKNGYLGPRTIWKSYLAESGGEYFGNIETKSERYLQNIKKPRYNKTKNIIESAIIEKEYFDEAVRRKTLPDVPWAIRRWNKFDLDDLAKHVLAGNYRSKKWAYFATNCTMFEKTLQGHDVLTARLREGSPAEKIREDFFEFLEHWPKTKNGVASLEEAFNQGMNKEDILALKPKSPKELKEYTVFWRQIYNKNKLSLNSTYQPPKVQLKEGWEYVDHTDAHLMSDLYKSCFSNNQHYINKIVQGKAFAIHRPRIGNGDLGALVYYELGKNKEETANEWTIFENKAYGNETTDKKYTNEAIAVGRAVTITHPEPFPEVIQNEKLLLEEKTTEAKKYQRVYAVHRSTVRHLYDNLKELCAVENVEELLAINGYKINIDEYIVEEISREEKFELERKNREAQEIFNGIKEVLYPQKLEEISKGNNNNDHIGQSVEKRIAFALAI